MGFGLLTLGYLTVLGVLPTSFVYNSYTVAIPIIGGAIMFTAFRKLQVYNIYFKAMKYISIAYIALLSGLAPFLVIYHRDMSDTFLYVSRVARTILLFSFHYFLLYAVNSLAREIDNPVVKRISRRNIYITYVYFGVSILSLFPIFGAYEGHFQLFSLIFGIVYYILMIINIYSCYMRITTE